MPTSIEPAGVDGNPRSERETPGERAPASEAGPKRRQRTRQVGCALPPLPLLVTARLPDLPEMDEHRRAIQQAVDRIADWVPKGIHFGWEKSFENKGKFPATMNKDAARLLVAELLRSAPLAIYPNRRSDGSVSGQLRVVVEAGRIVGTRGQQRVRIVIVRDATGFLVENAFPVHEQ